MPLGLTCNLYVYLLQAVFIIATATSWSKFDAEHWRGILEVSVFVKFYFIFLLDIFAAMALLFNFQKTKQQRNLCSDKGCHSAFRYSVGTVL